MNATDPKKGAKIILKLLIVTWRPALRKNQGGPSNRKTTRMLYIRFWVHWLAEHAPKSVKYQFTKPGGVTSKDPKEQNLFWSESF